MSKRHKCSLRLWNRVFWHQNLRLDLTSLSNFTVDQLSFLRKNRLLARYSKIFLAFFISGLIHLTDELVVDMPWHTSGSIRFFCTQGLGILLEDIVKAAYHRAFDPQPTALKPWARMVGYFWVFVFLTWSSPVWYYPRVMFTITTNQKQLPFSLISYFNLGSSVLLTAALGGRQNNTAQTMVSA